MSKNFTYVNSMTDNSMRQDFQFLLQVHRVPLEDKNNKKTIILSESELISMAKQLLYNSNDNSQAPKL